MITITCTRAELPPLLHELMELFLNPSATAPPTGAPNGLPAPAGATWFTLSIATTLRELHKDYQFGMLR